MHAHSYDERLIGDNVPQPRAPFCIHCGAPVDADEIYREADEGHDGVEVLLRLALECARAPGATVATLAKIADPGLTLDAFAEVLAPLLGRSITRQGVRDRLATAAARWPGVAPLLLPRAAGALATRPAGRGGKPAHVNARDNAARTPPAATTRTCADCGAPFSAGTVTAQRCAACRLVDARRRSADLQRRRRLKITKRTRSVPPRVAAAGWW